MWRPSFLPIYARIHACCSVKLFFLSLLSFQNAAVVMLMSYTQQRQASAGAERFAVTHVVLMQEVTKLFASLVWCAVDVYRFVRAHGVDMDEKATALGGPEEARQQPTKVAFVKEASSSSCSSLNEDSNCKNGVAEGLEQIAPPTKADAWRLCKRQFCSELLHQSALWMLLPAVLYSLQNCCIYLALANIEPALFQVTYQSRILITALFMMCFLKRTFSLRQWLALVLLVFGVTAAQLENRVSAVSRQSSVGTFKGNYIIGVAATAASFTMSSAASVLMEGFFKSKSTSLNSFTSTKNVHLSFYSSAYFAALQLLGGVGGGFAEFRQTGLAGSVAAYFRGFDYLVWVLVLLQAIGGLVVAVVLKYSDNIMRTFASGFSLALSGFCSSYLYSFTPGALFLIGNVVSIGAITMYSC
ncbi:CMP-sialic acid transporter [Trypanosoma conorhini]|uniref:CMP-sialic acid transporter n=1 Tax=Trypanosoma conorhini TaxID=83891 RepID=A0A422QC93_9TRYP|nr:CMP-sialic acid transporter [Trypanosoma conorhini]RNF27555.1 CMP-sialic acid transporter [Trypanosoma conorhini]